MSSYPSACFRVIWYRYQPGGVMTDHDLWSLRSCRLWCLRVRVFWIPGTSHIINVYFMLCLNYAMHCGYGGDCWAELHVKHWLSRSPHSVIIICDHCKRTCVCRLEFVLYSKAFWNPACYKGPPSRWIWELWAIRAIFVRLTHFCYQTCKQH